MKNSSRSNDTANRPSEGPFGGALREWRTHRGLSQLALSLDAGVSPRHISFLETGRSAPSREMILRLADALNVPLRERNRLFLVAGYAPPYPETRLSEEQLAEVKRAVRLLLDRHDPYPAYAMDGAWDVVASNRTYRAMVAELLHPLDDGEVNILRMFFSPRLLRPAVADWESSARAILYRVQGQLNTPGGAPERFGKIVDEIREYPGVEELWSRSFDPTGFDVFVPLSVRVGGRTFRWLTTIVTFGGAVDVTVAELTVECFFPANEDTERFARRQSASLTTNGDRTATPASDDPSRKE